jgi:hypothetical protein
MSKSTVEPNNGAGEQRRIEASPVASEQSTRPTAQTRKSYGPEFDFEETKVSFQQSSSSQDNEDEDSDDGLFAKPLTARRNQSHGKQSAPQSPEPKRNPGDHPLLLTLRQDPERALRDLQVAHSSGRDLSWAVKPQPWRRKQ